MNATALVAPVTTRRSGTQTIRIALAAIVIVVLLAVAFVVGRVTVNKTSHAPAIVPASVHAAPDPPTPCLRGGPC
jgi:hypothetical protein